MAHSSPASTRHRLFSSCLAEGLMLVAIVMTTITMLAATARSTAPDQPLDAMQPFLFNQRPGEPVGCQVSLKYPAKVMQWCELISTYALLNNLEPDLIAALIWQESGGNAEAYSHSGAVGLMQVMPRDGLAANFVCKGKPCFADRPTIVELRDPEFNIRYGTSLLADLRDHYNGDLRDALKSYGPMDMGYRYADIVLGLYNQYKD